MIFGYPIIAFFETLGVPNKKQTISFVGRSDTRSWNNKRLDLITCFLQFLAEGFKVHRLVAGTDFAFHSKFTYGFHHTDEPSNVFTKHPSGPDRLDNTEHFRPEVAVILCSLSFSCCGERLAGEASKNNVNCSDGGLFFFIVKLGYVCVEGDAGKSLRQQLPPFGVKFHHCGDLNSGCNGSQVHSTDTGEE